MADTQCCSELANCRNKLPLPTTLFAGGKPFQNLRLAVLALPDVHLAPAELIGLVST